VIAIHEKDEQRMNLIDNELTELLVNIREFIGLPVRFSFDVEKSSISARDGELRT
jgi:hypothetical protein